MKKVFFALMAGLAVFACTPAEYDDTAIKEQIDNLDDRLTKVEEDLATLELNVAGMKTLAEALKTGKYVESVVELEDGTGYTITFSDETTIVVKHGEKGATGEKGDTGDTGEAGKTPTVIVKDVDGVFYWFINGEQGPAVYEEAPVFTSEDGNLYVTYPDGTKKYVGTLTGKSIFDTVVPNVEEGTVTFTFVGENGEPGDSFVLPLAEAFSLEIAASVGLSKDQTEVEIPYTVKGATETTVVDVLAVACEAVVEAEVIKVSNIAAGAQMLVFADNGEGKTSIKKVVFASESYSVEAVDYVIPGEGGEVVVKGVSNVHFEVVIPAEATWLTQVVAKSAFELTFAADKNPGEERSAKVDFVRQGTEEVLMSVTIAQPSAKPFAEKVWSIAAVFGGGQDRNMTMDSEYIYVAQAAGGNGAVKAISIADPTQIKDVKVKTYTPAGLDNGTHAISCVRMMPNTDPAVNGGKDVLIASNLTTGDGTEKLIVYIWKDGIDADPDYWCISSGTRRLGDKFTVRGNYQKGELLFWDYGRTDDAAIRVNFKAGEAGQWGSKEDNYATGRYSIPVNPKSEGANSIGEATIHPDATFDADGNPTAIFASTNIACGFVNQTKGNAYALSAWGTDPDLMQTWGYQFFEHNGTDYIAYVKIPTDRNNAILNIIEDVNGAADFQGTLESKSGLVTFNLLDAPASAGTAGHGVGDCATAVVDGVRYIAVMGQNMGVALYKLN